MNYVLLLWITGCVGLNCPIPDFVDQEYESLEQCNQSLEVAMEVARLTKKKYAGICVTKESAERVIGERAQWK